MASLTDILAALQNGVQAINGLNATVAGANGAADPVSEAVINFSSSGNHTIVAAAVSKTTKVYSMFFVVSAATTLDVRSGTTSLTGPMSFAGVATMIQDYRSAPWYTCAVNSDFIITSTSSAQVSGRAYYTQT